MKTLLWKDTHTPSYLREQSCGAAWVPADGGLGGEDAACTRSGMSPGRENELLPSATTRMDLAGSVLSEIRPRKTSAIWFHVCVESKKIK